MKESWQRFWQDRTPRERWIVAAGAGALLVAFAYAYLWLPIARERARLITGVPQLRTQAQNMRADAPLIERLRTSAKAVPADLNTALAGFPVSKQAGAAAPQMITEANGRIRVVFESVRSDEWLRWIGAIALKRIRIETVRIDALPEAGMIKASATFAGGDP